MLDKMKLTRVRSCAMRATESVTAPHGYDLYADLSRESCAETVVIDGVELTFATILPYQAAAIRTGCKVDEKHSFIVTSPQDIKFPKKISVMLPPRDHKADVEIKVLVVNYSDKPFHVFDGGQIARLIPLDRSVGVVIS